MEQTGPAAGPTTEQVLSARSNCAPMSGGSPALGRLDADLRLRFIQDHLPFDKGGRLLTAALKTPEFRHANDILKRKVARLTAEHQEAEENPVEDTGNQASPSAPIDDDPDADVNLVAWAKGKVKIQPFVIYRVARKRFAKDFRTIAAVKAFLIETKAVDANEVAN